jgi:hypothetical protein
MIAHSLAEDARAFVGDEDMDITADLVDEDLPLGAPPGRCCPTVALLRVLPHGRLPGNDESP